MLARSRERCAPLGLTPELYEQSLDTLSLPFAYSTVIIALASFQLIIDRKEALAALNVLRRHMAYQATLLIDIFVPEIIVNRSTQSCVRIDSHREIRLTKRFAFHEQEQLAQAFCCYELLVDGIVKQQENELLELIWYSEKEFALLLNQSGFEVVAIHERSFRDAEPSRIVQARAVAI